MSDLEEADGLLREAIAVAAPNLFWTQAHPKRNRANFHTVVLPERTFYIFAPKAMDPNVFKERMIALGVAQVYFSVSLKYTSILFQTFYLGEKNGMLGFRFPKKIYTTQRRKDPRITLRENYIVKGAFQMPSGVECFKIFDISVGGISLEIDREEAVKFNSGDHHKSVKFTLIETALDVDVQVRIVRPNRFAPNKAIVGLQFTRIDPESLEFVGHYVEDEALYINTLDTINIFSD